MSQQTQNSQQYNLKPAQRSVKGLRALGPGERKYWDALRRIATQFSYSYGYGHVALPVLEQASLFRRTLGKNADLVQDDLLVLTDEQKNEYAVLPSIRVPLARAYIERGLYEAPQPVKLFTEGMFIKNDPSQNNRLRQSYHYTYAAFGSNDPLLDAQLIFITFKQLVALGLTDLVVKINSVGSLSCQEDYRKALIEYLRGIKSELTDDEKKSIAKTPLDIIKRLSETSPDLSAQAPQTVDFLNEEDQKHFMKVLEYLDELEVPYLLNNVLFPSDDYMTHTQFEIFSEHEQITSKAPLVRGHRCNELLNRLVQHAIPSVYASLYYDRILNALQSVQAPEPRLNECDVFVAQLGEEAKKKSIWLFEELRSSGLAVAEDLAQDGLKAQLASAEVCGVKFALILGHKEIMDGTIMVRDMENGIQEIIDFKKVVPEITKRLEKHNTITKQTKKK